MSNNTRIFHTQRNFTLKHSQALRAIAEGALMWVELGVSVRNATLPESIAARNAQAKASEPIAQAEIPGLTFQQPTTASVSMHERYALIQQANQLCEA
jgi:hypothetical protein